MFFCAECYTVLVQLCGIQTQMVSKTLCLRNVKSEVMEFIGVLKPGCLLTLSINNNTAIFSHVVTSLIHTKS